MGPQWWLKTVIEQVKVVQEYIGNAKETIQYCAIIRWYFLSQQLPLHWPH